MTSNLDRAAGDLHQLPNRTRGLGAKSVNENQGQSSKSEVRIAQSQEMAVRNEVVDTQGKASLTGAIEKEHAKNGGVQSAPLDLEIPIQHPQSGPTVSIVKP